MKNAKYQELLEYIIDYQAALSKALLNCDWNEVEIFSNKIGIIIRKILKDNLMKVENNNNI